jgi:hypothetical protein
MPSPAPHSPPPAAAAELAQASRALWLATLALMTAFMQHGAPAHRCLLARRIARNLDTLSRQPECFGRDCCARFARLASRWQHRAEGLAEGRDTVRDTAGGLRGWLRNLLPFPGPAR